MSAPFLVIVILAVVSLAGASTLAHIRRKAPVVITAGKIGSMSRDQVLTLLSEVEKSKEPVPVMGAMCYEPVAVPNVMEYVCPECGGKTLYELYDDYYELEAVAEGRVLFAELQGLTSLSMSLDESSYCDFCRADSVSDPAMILTVTWDDGSTHSSGVGVEDLRMLIGLFSRSLEYSTWNEGTLPLRPSIDRLCEILGLEPPEEAPAPEGEGA